MSMAARLLSFEPPDGNVAFDGVRVNVPQFSSIRVTNPLETPVTIEEVRIGSGERYSIVGPSFPCVLHPGDTREVQVRLHLRRLPPQLSMRSSSPAPGPSSGPPHGSAESQKSRVFKDVFFLKGDWFEQKFTATFAIAADAATSAAAGDKGAVDTRLRRPSPESGGIATKPSRPKSRNASPDDKESLPSPRGAVPVPSPPTDPVSAADSGASSSTGRRKDTGSRGTASHKHSGAAGVPASLPDQGVYVAAQSMAPARSGTGIDSLEKKISDLENEVTMLRQSHYAADADVRAIVDTLLASERADYERKSRRALELLVAKDHEIAERNARIDSFDTVMTDIQARLSETQRLLDQEERRSDQLEREREILAAQLRVCEARPVVAAVPDPQVTAKVGELRDALLAKERHLADLEIKLGETHRANTRLDEQLTAALERIDRGDREQEAYVEKLRMRISKLESIQASARETVLELEQQSADIKRGLRKVTHAAVQTDTSLVGESSLMQENAAMRRDLAVIRSDAQTRERDFRTRIEELEHLLDAANAEAQLARDEAALRVASLVETCSKLSKKSILHGELASLADECASLRMDNQRLSAEKALILRKRTASPSPLARTREESEGQSSPGRAAPSMIATGGSTVSPPPVRKTKPNWSSSSAAASQLQNVMTELDVARKTIEQKGDAVRLLEHQLAEARALDDTVHALQIELAEKQFSHETEMAALREKHDAEVLDLTRSVASLRQQLDAVRAAEDAAGRPTSHPGVGVASRRVSEVDLRAELLEKEGLLSELSAKLARAESDCQRWHDLFDEKVAAHSVLVETLASMQKSDSGMEEELVRISGLRVVAEVRLVQAEQLLDRRRKDYERVSKELLRREEREKRVAEEHGVVSSQRVAALQEVDVLRAELDRVRRETDLELSDLRRDNAGLKRSLDRVSQERDEIGAAYSEFRNASRNVEASRWALEEQGRRVAERNLAACLAQLARMAAAHEADIGQVRARVRNLEGRELDLVEQTIALGAECDRLRAEGDRLQMRATARSLLSLMQSQADQSGTEQKLAEAVLTHASQNLKVVEGELHEYIRQLVNNVDVECLLREVASLRVVEKALVVRLGSMARAEERLRDEILSLRSALEMSVTSLTTESEKEPSMMQSQQPARQEPASTEAAAPSGIGRQLQSLFSVPGLASAGLLAGHSHVSASLREEQERSKQLDELSRLRHLLEAACAERDALRTTVEAHQERAHQLQLAATIESTMSAEAKRAQEAIHELKLEIGQLQQQMAEATRRHAEELGRMAKDAEVRIEVVRQETANSAVTDAQAAAEHLQERLRVAQAERDAALSEFASQQAKVANLTLSLQDVAESSAIKESALEKLQRSLESMEGGKSTFAKQLALARVAESKSLSRCKALAREMVDVRIQLAQCQQQQQQLRLSTTSSSARPAAQSVKVSSPADYVAATGEIARLNVEVNMLRRRCAEYASAAGGAASSSAEFSSSLVLPAVMVDDGVQTVVAKSVQRSVQCESDDLASMAGTTSSNVGVVVAAHDQPKAKAALSVTDREAAGEDGSETDSVGARTKRATVPTRATLSTAMVELVSSMSMADAAYVPSRVLLATLRSEIQNLLSVNARLASSLKTSGDGRQSRGASPLVPVVIADQLDVTRAMWILAKRCLDEGIPDVLREVVDSQLTAFDVSEMIYTSALAASESDPVSLEMTRRDVPPVRPQKLSETLLHLEEERVRLSVTIDDLTTRLGIATRSLDTVRVDFAAKQRDALERIEALQAELEKANIKTATASESVVLAPPLAEESDESSRRKLLTHFKAEITQILARHENERRDLEMQAEKLRSALADTVRSAGEREHEAHRRVVDEMTMERKRAVDSMREEMRATRDAHSEALATIGEQLRNAVRDAQSERSLRLRSEDDLRKTQTQLEKLAEKEKKLLRKEREKTARPAKRPASAPRQRVSALDDAAGAPLASHIGAVAAASASASAINLEQERTVARLQAETDVLKEQLTRERNRQTEMRRELSQAEQQLRIVEASLRTTESDLEKAQTRIRGMRADEKRRVEMIEKLKADRSLLEEKLLAEKASRGPSVVLQPGSASQAAAPPAASSVDVAHVDMSASLLRKDAALKAMKERIASQEEAVKRLTTERDELLEKVRSLSSDVLRKDNTMKLLRTKADALETEREEASKLKATVEKMKEAAERTRREREREGDRWRVALRNVVSEQCEAVVAVLNKAQLLPPRLLPAPSSMNRRTAATKLQSPGASGTKGRSRQKATRLGEGRRPRRAVGEQGTGAAVAGLSEDARDVSLNLLQMSAAEFEDLFRSDSDDDDGGGDDVSDSIDHGDYSGQAESDATGSKAVGTLRPTIVPPPPLSMVELARLPAALEEAIKAANPRLSEDVQAVLGEVFADRVKIERWFVTYYSQQP